MSTTSSMTEKKSQATVQPADGDSTKDVEKLDGAKPPSEEDEAEANFQPKSMKFWATMVSIFMALFLVALDRTIIGTAIPRITVEFQSLGDIGWYGSAYQLTTSACQLMFGRIYKFYDIKKTFFFCIAIFEIGSAVCGAAPNSIAFILGRAIAGLGSAGIFSGVMMIMVPLIPLRKRPMFQGFFGAIFGIASVMGPLIGGGFTDSTVSWRWCFYVNLPIGAVAVACLIFTLKLPKTNHETVSIWKQFVRLDPLGTFFFVPSVVSLLLALQWGGSTYAWNSSRIIALLVVFAVLWLAFCAVQVLKPETATVPPRIITQRTVLAASIFMFCVAGSMMMIVFYLPLWFQVVQGVSAVKSGIYTIPIVLSMVVASIMSGGVTQKIGYYVPAMIISPSLLAVGEGLMSTFSPGESSSRWIGYQFLAGFGLGIGMQSSGLAVQAVLGRPDVPTGVSIIFFMQQLGGAIFTSVGQNLLSTYLVDELSGVIPGGDAAGIVGSGATDIVSKVPENLRDTILQIYNHAITRIFLCGMGVALVAAVAALFVEWKNIKKTGPRRAPPPAGSDKTATESTTSEEAPKRADQTASPSSARQSTEKTKSVPSTDIAKGKEAEATH
ncbi:hypothetical protein JX266_001913 [Neoarthrinium moseri]|nr:hypothetical protein JX266_001913 [Neoarthrinium moseri]